MKQLKNRLTALKGRLTAHKKSLGKGAVLMAAVLAVIWGGKIPGGPGGRAPENEESLELEETEETKAVIPLPVNEKEEALLESLYQAMEKKELDRAAEILNSEENLLRTLVQGTLEGKKYLYWLEETEGEPTGRMEELTKETKGRGLAVTRFNTIFFGEFSKGMPEGDCAALQAMVLAEPRFTYADGEWKNGKMNGHGRTGYRYYENVPEAGFVMAEKEGRYQENLLEGDFIYTTENAKGERLCWSMQAENGVTVLSEKWIFHKNNGTYMLPSEEDPERAYVLSESQAETIMWNNLIVWDEQ